jgi:psiF repeat
MKHLMTVLALSVACFSTMTSTSAFATSHKEAPEMGKQQSKMGECNKDERKAFMKTCLSAKKASQQEKMKACNADPKAKAAKGDERKAFMKECLSK